MKTMMVLLMAVLAPLALSACGLTPKQIQALDGAMCTKTAGYGVSNTTVIVGGASKSQGVVVKGEDCSVATAGFAK